MASEAQPKVYQVHFNSRLKAVLPFLPREKRNALLEAAAALLNRIDPVAQRGLGEHGMTSVWASLSFGRVGLSILHHIIVITFVGSIPEGPDDRPPGVAALAASELTDALRASAHLYISLNPAVPPVPARFMPLVPTCGDTNGSIDLRVAGEGEPKMAVVRKAAFCTSTTEWGGDLYLAPRMRRASIIIPGLVDSRIRGQETGHASMFWETDLLKSVQFLVNVAHPRPCQ